MIVGLDGLTLFHIAISLVGIAAGFVMVGGFLRQHQPRNRNSHVPLDNPRDERHSVSLSVQQAAAVAYCRHHFTRHPRDRRLRLLRRRTDGILAQNLCFRFLPQLSTSISVVLAAQTFAKNPALAALAPTQSELPFVATQGAILIAFLIIGYVSVKRFSTPRSSKPSCAASHWPLVY